MSSIGRNRYENQLIKKKSFNLTEVAYYLRCCKATVHNYHNRYGLPKHYGKGKGMNAFYLKKEVDEWVRNHVRLIIR